MKGDREAKRLIPMELALPMSAFARLLPEQFVGLAVQRLRGHLTVPRPDPLHFRREMRGLANLQATRASIKSPYFSTRLSTASASKRRRSGSVLSRQASTSSQLIGVDTVGVASARSE